MASTAPAKSQALHNFALPRLKWNKDNHNHSNGHHHRRRRSIKSPSCESLPSSGSALRDPQHQSPLNDSASAMLVQSLESSPVRDDLMKNSPLCSESPLNNSVKQSSPMGGDSMKQFLKHNLAHESEASKMNKSILIEYSMNHLRDSVLDTNKNGFYKSNLDLAIEKSEKTHKATEADVSAKRSRILLKIHQENESEENQQEDPQKIDNNLDENGDDNEGKMNNNEEEPKTWNLRPRKAICKTLNGVTGKINRSSMHDKKAHSPLRNSSSRLGENEANGGGGLQKKEKRKLSVLISLSKEEIEEDVFSLTGSKPTRRPKKRVKNIQKHLDSLFPGLWLTSITPDSYI